MKVICYFLVDDGCVGYADMSVRPQKVHWRSGFEDSDTTSSLVLQCKESDLNSLFGMSEDAVRKNFSNVLPHKIYFEAG